MKVYLILSIVLLLCSCQDDNYHTIVRGTVIHDGTKEPIEGVLIRMKDGVASSFFGVDSNTSSGAVSETYSDENGQFEISLKGEHRAVLGASKEGYFNFGVEGMGSGGLVRSFPDGVTENVVLTLDAEASFNGVFINSNGSSSDLTQLRIAGRTSDYEEGKEPFCF